jgi:MFS transporter, DHA1 family, multidrug resistance protein
VVGDVVKGRGGTPVAFWQMSSDLGAVVGPVAAGVLVDRGSFALALLVSAAVVGVCGLSGLAVPGGRGYDDDAPEPVVDAQEGTGPSR